MVKKSTLLAALIVAVVCGSAPPAEAQTWLAYFGVKRWYRHYHAQAAGTVGWDYASSGFGHHGWGSSPRDWGAVIAWSARPWPPAVDAYFVKRKHNGDFDGPHPRHGFRGYPPPNGGYAVHGHGDPYGYGFPPRHGFRRGHGVRPGWVGWGHGVGPLGGPGPLGGVVYDDVNGMIYDGGVQGVLPGEGPAKKGAEPVEPPPAQPKKTSLPPATTLVLNVPADARVTLAGVDTNSNGTTREFVTSLLEGSPWTDYTVHVEIQRDGQKLVDERTITLFPGDKQEMTIDFAAQVASR